MSAGFVPGVHDAIVVGAHMIIHRNAQAGKRASEESPQERVKRVHSSDIGRGGL